MESSDNKIFALDIGTRSVVGIVAEGTGEGLRIIASDYIEHKQRAMLDGQIHDVEQVAKAVRTIKECLEKKTETRLNRVAVAAAGRALKTVRTKVSENLNETVEISRDKILSLELSAVQEAQKLLLAEASSSLDASYHCVGYSIVHYELDGDRIGNLAAQKGSSIGVEILATFLPRVVVDSLSAVLQRAGLEMMSLTLEPIAASTVVIPPNMRMLNLALVDIGAGTSDIAVSDDGTIIGYDMVPIAGDEITEKLCEKYLLDFGVGELVKRELMTQKEVLFVDVLGVEQQVPAKEIIEAIDETISGMCRQIAEKIITLNGKPPQAVICIGGGSLTPLLTEKLAAYLNLSPNRVAIRGREIIPTVGGDENLAGPEAVTSIGIAFTAYQNNGLGFAKVTVNNQLVRLFEVNQGTVADAILAAGIDMKKVYPRLGMAMTLTVNGQLKIIKGTRGTPAVIKVNGVDATLDTPVKHNDVIFFQEAVDGENARGYVRDVVPSLEQITIRINGRTIFVKPLILMNDELVDMDDELVDGAKITYELPNTLGMVLSMAGMEHISSSEYKIMVNGWEADFDQTIEDGDEIIVSDGLEESLGQIEATYIEEAAAGEKVATDSISREIYGFAEADSAGEQHITAPDEDVFIKSSGGDGTIVIVNEEKIVVPRKNIIFADVLAHINFSPNPPGPGSVLVTQVNGLPAEFTTPLKDGDKVCLTWQMI